MAREVKKTRTQLEAEIAEKDKKIAELKEKAETAEFNAITALDVSASLYEMLLSGGGEK
ncbi:hypothetical protein [Anaerovorax sp. IOR16]|uniref:hypothetical protein n=1 Tax=Anaerovorax sp. IOR16 TaxID=2773458 RepID=UPI0019D1DA40|nr:hypothetical protein [Anaerovorax sp. IOR16]